jgi:hypothetical protein
MNYLFAIPISCRVYSMYMNEYVLVFLALILDIKYIANDE